jgi:hypothetical protein
MHNTDERNVVKVANEKQVTKTELEYRIWKVLHNILHNDYNHSGERNDK